jgi:hypothetical protein
MWVHQATPSGVVYDAELARGEHISAEELAKAMRQHRAR